MPRIAYLGSAVPLDLERRMLGELGRDDVEVYEVDSDNAGRPARGSLSGADALVIEWGKADARTFEAAPQLRCVSMMAIGHDNIDDAAATAHGCWVTNVPDYCTYDVALHTLGLIVDLYKKITWFDRQVRDGVWDDMAGYDAPRPQGQTAGLVFFGSIAQALTPMLKSIGMEVMAYAPTKSPAFLASHGVAKAESLEELLEVLDTISSPMLLGMCDVVVPFVQGEDPADYPLRLGDRMAHLHLVDSDGGSETHLLPGEGRMDLRTLLYRFREAGYDGRATLELVTHYISDPSGAARTALEQAKELLL